MIVSPLKYDKNTLERWEKDGWDRCFHHRSMDVSKPSVTKIPD